MTRLQVYKPAILTGQSLLKLFQQNSLIDEEAKMPATHLCSEVYQCAGKQMH